LSPNLNLNSVYDHQHLNGVVFGNLDGNKDPDTAANFNRSDDDVEANVDKPAPYCSLSLRKHL
jgi:hypothetical protein